MIKSIKSVQVEAKFELRVDPASLMEGISLLINAGAPQAVSALLSVTHAPTLKYNFYSNRLALISSKLNSQHYAMWLIVVEVAYANVIR